MYSRHEERSVAVDAATEDVFAALDDPTRLIIGGYRMSFDVTPNPAGSQLRVAIDYELPPSGVGRFLGWLFGRAYARWCVRQMTDDAVKLFAQSGTPVDSVKPNKVPRSS